ncbi:MAG: GNAT family N-acetyltransferase [Campylobacteraceae bacterium]|jgi:putative acetyltransferase|nr:GNAT family N-acetyltransferase [Campylobacteraceae bacterium]
MMKNIEPIDKAEYEKIILIWEESVKATHHFLTDEDIAKIKLDVIKYLPCLKIYACKDSKAKILGFIGIFEKKIEMLFVSPKYIGKGVGGALANFAINSIGAREVDVNEQNYKARKFYEHIGFRVYSRSSKDAQGRAFPLLHMKISNVSCM